MDNENQNNDPMIERNITDLAVCSLCGAALFTQDEELHVYWHNKIKRIDGYARAAYASFRNSAS